MENYDPSLQKNESQPSSTTANQYGHQNEGRERTIDNDTRYGTDQSTDEQNNSNLFSDDTSAQRPSQYNAADDDEDTIDDDDDMEEDEMDDDDTEMDDMDEMEEEDDTERGTSAFYQSYSTQRGVNYANMMITF